MRQEVIVAVLVALAAFAGCIEAPRDEEVATAAAQESPVLAELGAVALPAANATANATWYVVPVTVRPEGGLTGFEWTIPEGAVVPWGFNDLFDADETTVALEVALLGGADVDTWGMVFFEEGQQGLEAGSGYLSFAATSLVYTATSETSFATELRTTDFTTLGDDAKAGQLLRGIAIARGLQTQDAAIAFRVLDHDPHYPDSEEEPAGSPDAFVASRAAAPPLALEPLATGTGFSFHGYFDLLLGGLTPTDTYVGIESILGAPTYEWSAPPKMRALGGAHSFAGETASQFPHGFDVVSADYYSIATGRTSYAADITFHGEELSASDTDVEAGVVGLVAGLPPAGGGAYAWGDGDGDTSAALVVDRVLTSGLVAVSSFSLLELGADIEDLLGAAAAAESGAEDFGQLFPGAQVTPRGLVQRDAHGATWTYALPGYAEALRS